MITLIDIALISACALSTAAVDLENVHGGVQGFIANDSELMLILADGEIRYLAPSNSDTCTVQ